MLPVKAFFGRMKTEMYYPLNWDSTEELRQAIHTYIDFYNNHRIKIGLNGKTITEYRAMIAQMSKNCPKPLLAYSSKKGGSPPPSSLIFCAQ